MLKYGLYTRKSHDDKKLTEKSIGEQLTEGRRLAERDGLTIVWHAEESKSAKVPGVRPRYSQLIRLVKKGTIDGIICWHVNRLVRNMQEGGELVQLLIDGKILEIRTPHAIYRSGDNILPVVLEAASATQYSIDLKNTVARSMDGNFRSGGWNHKAPPGYANTRDPLNSKRGRVEPDQSRFRLVRKAWDMMLTEAVTVRDVWSALTEWGYRVRPTLNLPERPLGYFAVSNLFRNPFYAGFVRERGMMAKGRHEPMVTVDEFQRVQRLLDRHSFTAKRHHTHAYTGFMRCAYCGQYITAECKRLQEKGSLWEIYHCSDSYNRCTQKGIAATGVDEQLSALIGSVSIAPTALEIAAEDIRRSLEKQHQAFAARLKLQQDALAAIEERLTRLTDMWLSGLLTDQGRYKQLESDLLAEQGQAQLAVSSSSSDYGGMLAKLDRAVIYLKTGHDRFLKAPPQRKRPIAQAMGTYSFFGREKRIDLTVRPIIRELVDFAKQVTAPLEPRKSGSRKQNRAAFEKQLYFGRRGSSRIELPDGLFVALMSDDLPDLDEDDAPEDLADFGEAA